MKSSFTLALVVMGGGLGTTALADPPQGMPQAMFEWSMAERTSWVINTDFKPGVNVEHRMIEGPGGQPGLYDGVSSVPLDEINPPDGYEVTFDGCASTGRITQYEWRIDGKRVAKSKSCNLTTHLAEGLHRVKLVVNGGGRKSASTKEVVIKDYLVVSMGDSYSSGEGNPTNYVAGEGDSLPDANGAGWSEGGYWDYVNCHRSTRSGQANAAIDLEQADPHSSVTFIYLACSGAQVDSGILGIKDGSSGIPEQPQAKQAYDLTLGKGRNIDALMLGIGGNDIGFVSVVAECALQADCMLSTEKFPVIGTPNLPVTDKNTGVTALELFNLTLNPEPGFTELLPGPPWRVLESETLHACDSKFQFALLGAGGIGPDESCRESIGTSPAGLKQVHDCFTGGPDSCTSVPSYYNFAEGAYKYPGGDTWHGLEVEPERIFYTEYPDLTTKFNKPVQEKDLEYCDISFTIGGLSDLLEGAKSYVDNSAHIDSLISDLNTPGALGFNFGLTQNEFKYAALAVLGGTDGLDGTGIPGGDVEQVLENTLLTGPWKVKAPGAPFSKHTIGPGEDVDFINLGTESPALNEVTRLVKGLYGWSPVTGTFSASSGHGLCVLPPGSPYAYLIGSAQGTNISGSAHPNMLGMETYRTPLFSTIAAALFGTQ
jgi:hypothetical protein